MTSASGYITTNEAAEALGVSRQRVLQLIQDGRLKAEKFANVYMIWPDDLSNIEGKPMGRPPRTTDAGKLATGQKNASNGPSGSKKGNKK